MGSLRGHDEALGPGKGLGSLKDLYLVIGYRPHYPVMDEARDNRGIPVVTESPCMHGGRNEVMPEREHLQEGCQPCDIPEIIGIHALREGRA